MTKEDVINYLKTLICDTPIMNRDTTIGVKPAVCKGHENEILLAINMIKEYQETEDKITIDMED